MKQMLALVVAIWAAGSAPASAQQDGDAQARAHFDAGRALVAEARFEQAYAEFRAGHEISGRPLFLFNMAECALHGGDRDGARRDYARYLAAAPQGGMAETARQRLEELGPAPQPDLSPARAASTVMPMQSPMQPAPAPRELWEEGWFWGVLGGVAAAVLAAAIAGIVVATQGSPGPMCNDGCVVADFR